MCAIVPSVLYSFPGFDVPALIRPNHPTSAMREGPAARAQPLDARPDAFAVRPGQVRSATGRPGRCGAGLPPDPVEASKASG
ncbi:hypothetical protein Asi03nite_32070 [Actinoplanes siamensis]|uniref:Uncharacterized protein n=1 Tax=Actinoplanes siamensis TaxID=1223317 RepID=A0A919N7E7_9ACTN|nr:hypothetical protein Asi03nite_32070 [Actinoplanes siamensis]